MAKVDPELGKKVNKFLIQNRVETPTISMDVSNESKIHDISKSVREIMVNLGLNMADDSLCDTPDRVAKMYVNEIFSGLDYNNFPKCTVVDNKMGYEEMVVTPEITAISTCEHHLVTIDQKVTIGYIPREKVLGLSKLNRIAKFFARRPQIQERCTEQIYYALKYILRSDDIGVIIKGKHYCVASRGVEDSSSYTVTSKLGGAFRSDPATRKEFMDLRLR